MRAPRVVLHTIAAAVIVAMAPSRVVGQATAIPPVVTQGLDSLVAGNPTSAVGIWARSWTGADTALAAPLLESLGELNKVLGKPLGYDLVKIFDVGPNLRKIYVMIRYTRQPLYARFAAYRPGRDWQVIDTTFNTNPTEVIPSSLLAPP